MNLLLIVIGSLLGLMVICTYVSGPWFSTPVQDDVLDIVLAFVVMIAAALWTIGADVSNTLWVNYLVFGATLATLILAVTFTDEVLLLDTPGDLLKGVGLFVAISLVPPAAMAVIFLLIGASLVKDLRKQRERQKARMFSPPPRRL